jgi:hypothetical protein
MYPDYPYVLIDDYDKEETHNSVLNKEFYIFYFKNPLVQSPYILSSFSRLTAEEVGQEMGGN